MTVIILRGVLKEMEVPFKLSDEKAVLVSKLKEARAKDNPSLNCSQYNITRKHNDEDQYFPVVFWLASRGHLYNTIFVLLYFIYFLWFILFLLFLFYFHFLFILFLFYFHFIFILLYLFYFFS